MEPILFQNRLLNAETVITAEMFIQKTIDDMKSGKILTYKMRRYSESTIRQYTMMQRNFLAFQENIRKTHNLGGDFKLSFAMINPEFFSQFRAFIVQYNEKITLNSASQIIKKMKSIMSMAWASGLSPWNGSGIKTPTEETTQVILQLEELRKIRQTELTAHETKIVDIFISQCFTGLRYHTLCVFLRNPLAYIKEYKGSSYIDISDSKTDERSVIPLFDVVVEIITKYGGKINPYTESHINTSIKTICQKAGITTPVVRIRTENGYQKEELVSKNTMISTHTARRTFGTFMLEHDISRNSITAMTGHTNEQQLSRYIRYNDKLERIKNIFGNPILNVKV